MTYYSGYLSDFKITKYNAAYNTTSYFDYNRNNSNTSSIGYLPLYPFTSNSNYIAAYPPNTQFLISSTNAGIIDSTQKNNLITVGSAQLSSTVSKFGGTSMFFNGTTDYLSSPTNDFFRMGTGNFTIEFWAYWNAVSGTIPGNVLHTVTSGTTGLSIYIISNKCLPYPLFKNGWAISFNCFAVMKPILYAASSIDPIFNPCLSSSVLT